MLYFPFSEATPNSHGETIAESELLNIANRQLNIYDCCRGILDEKSVAFCESKTFAMDSYDNVRQKIRCLYDERIMGAIPQQSSLYACSIGESAYDTPNGAIYLNHLLGEAKHFEKDEIYKLVGIGHENASYKTSKEKNGLQNPQSILPKCLTSQQLILSINSQMYTRRF